MTEYTQRLTLAAPEAMMPQANQLALIMGESAADVHTFQTASWQDAAGNRYAICSTVAKPVVAAMLGRTLKPENIPAHAEDADLAQAQAALDSIVLFTPVDGELEPDDQVTPHQITLTIDHEPLAALVAMGLSQVVEDEAS